jgi:hypothetical protein
VTNGQPAQPGEHRNGEEEQQGGQVAGDHHRPAWQAVHPRADRQADQQPGQPCRRGEQRHLERARVEHGDRDERQGDAGDAAAQCAGRLADPEQPKVPVPEQTAATAISTGYARRPETGDRHGCAGTP